MHELSVELIKASGAVSSFGGLTLPSLHRFLILCMNVVWTCECVCACVRGSTSTPDHLFGATMSFCLSRFCDFLPLSCSRPHVSSHISFSAKEHLYRTITDYWSLETSLINAGSQGNFMPQINMLPFTVRNVRKREKWGGSVFWHRILT